MAIEVFPKADGAMAAVLNVLDQGRMGIPFDEFTVTSGKLRWEMRAAGLVIEGAASEDNTTVQATWQQGGNTLPWVLKAVAKVPGPPPRAQTPRRPYPYREEAVVFENTTDEVKLSGTLTLPASPKPTAGVLLVSGSGRNARDGGTGLGHFVLLADYLTRHGFAVLRYDKRGVMRSTGDFERATTEHFTADALSGIRYLRSHPEIDPDQVGIIGHSEGGIIAAMAAARSPEIAFIVSLGGSGLNGHDLMILQDCSEAAANGASETDIPVIRDWVTRFYAVAGSGEDPDVVKRKLEQMYTEMSDLEKQAFKTAGEFPKGGTTLDANVAASAWFRAFLSVDPAKSLRQVKCPVLALVGGKDTQVPAKENLEAIADALRAAGNLRSTVLELPGLNHLFQTAGDGSTSEYGDLEEIIAPQALVLVTHWIMQQIGRIP